MTLGRSKPKYTWQSLTIWILLVLNSFMKKRFNGKSKDLRSDLVSGQTSRPYTRTAIRVMTRKGALTRLWPISQLYGSRAVTYVTNCVTYTSCIEYLIRSDNDLVLFYTACSTKNLISMAGFHILFFVLIISIVLLLLQAYITQFVWLC